MSIERPTAVETGAIVAFAATAALIHWYIRPKLKRVERIEVEMQFVRRHPPRWLQWLRLPTRD